MMDIKFLLKQIGIPATLYGHRYLAYAVILATQNEDYLLSITTRLYEDVALHFNTNAKCVDRDMRTAISRAYNHGNWKVLEKIADRDIPYKPSNGEFIDILSTYLLKHQNHIA